LALPSFEAATQVTALEAPGRFAVDLHEHWTVLGKPNGGYLLAVLGRCGGLAVAQIGQDHPHCVAASITYIGAAAPTEAEVEVVIQRAGRGATQIRASLVQDEVVFVEASMTFSALVHDAPRLYDALPAIELPDRSACIPMPSMAANGETPSIMDGTDVRMDPATMDWSTGLDDGVGELRGWASFADGREIDALALLYLLDCFPPATFPLSSAGWVPTLQLTAYVRSNPAPGAVKIRQRAQVIESGFVDEVCEIWDARDRLVAQGTQLAMVRFA